jgi:hypothetical protein
VRSLSIVLTICGCGSGPPKSADGGSAGQVGDGGEGGSDSGSHCADYLDEEVLGVLSVHAHDLSLSAILLAGHASEREMVGFFVVPGLSGEDGVPGSFLIPVDTCSEPTMFDPFCEMNRCSRLACTGEGAGWTVSYWLEEPAQIAEFDFESARVDTTWADGATGIGFELQTAATGPGDRAWDVIGSGTMDVDAIEATVTFQKLLH